MQSTTAETCSSGTASLEDSGSVEEGGKEGKSRAFSYYKPNLNPFNITRGSVIGMNAKSRKFGWYQVFIMLKRQLFHVRDEEHSKNSTVWKPHSHAVWHCCQQTVVGSTANWSHPARTGCGLSTAKNSIQKNLRCRPCLASPIPCLQCHSAATSHTPPSQQEQNKKPKQIFRL